MGLISASEPVSTLPTEIKGTPTTAISGGDYEPTTIPIVYAFSWHMKMYEEHTQF